MSIADHTSTIMMLLLFTKLVQMAVKVLRPCYRLVALCFGCAVVAIAFLVSIVYGASKLFSPQRDLAKFIPFNITPSVIFNASLFMCIVYAMLATYLFVTTIVVPILAKGPIVLVPPGKENLYDLRDRKATLAA